MVESTNATAAKLEEEKKTAAEETKNAPAEEEKKEGTEEVKEKLTKHDSIKPEEAEESAAIM